ncbi:predicted protein [Streptomyces viridosporus ATCC 14672]|uniref:Predicted protein n=1 Tax=Streptomyces viridosporus (strain ATCC 14672 / DSM 40746 / JCM 4963 / KCTC 9882 / NRRL B-12104 / FH 1290) TaxID=566461 RepID=D5ZWX4_STRV1|nr:predicted protein [Streptomyces viridosporus ATCC 14672]
MTRLHGTAPRVTIFIGENDAFPHRPLSSEIAHRAHKSGLAGASVFHGIEGFGVRSAVLRRRQRRRRLGRRVHRSRPRPSRLGVNGRAPPPGARLPRKRTPVTLEGTFHGRFALGTGQQAVRGGPRDGARPLVHRGRQRERHRPARRRAQLLRRLRRRNRRQARGPRPQPSPRRARRSEHGSRPAVPATAHRR